MSNDDTNVNGGFVVLARRMFEGWLWRSLSPEHFRLALWLIYRARWKAEPEEILVGRQRFTVARGELWTTLANLAKDTGLTRKQVRVGLAKCSSMDLIRAHPRAHLGLHIKVVNYDRYQNLDHYQGHTRGHGEGTGRARVGHGRGTIRNKGNKKTRERKSAPSSRAARDSTPPTDAVLDVPCVDGTFYLTESKANEWVDTYTGIDVPTTLRVARQWAIDNPDRRKTMRGCLRFLSAWLAREQNRGGRRAAPESSAPRERNPNRTLTADERKQRLDDARRRARGQA
jgi:hypothetical protein